MNDSGINSELQSYISIIYLSFSLVKFVYSVIHIRVLYILNFQDQQCIEMIQILCNVQRKNLYSNIERKRPSFNIFHAYPDQLSHWSFFLLFLYQMEIAK